MDELMTLELDSPELGGDGNRVYAASHACICNPLRKKHYPKSWVPDSCAFTSQHKEPEKAQFVGPGPTAGIGCPNSGLVVLNPSKGVYDKIVQTLKNSQLTSKYQFPDQDLLGDVFYGRWVGLPYIYNGLKSLRWEGVHDTIWMDDKVKNVHYIFVPKPWDDREDDRPLDETHSWWHTVNAERVAEEKRKGIYERV